MSAPQKTAQSKLDRAASATQAATVVRVFCDALRKLGYDVDSLTRVSGLSSSVLNDPDGQVPCSAVAQMFGCAMQQRPLKNLGARLAAETPIGAYPLIDYLVLTSDNVGQGLHQLSQYFQLVNSPARLRLEEGSPSIRAVFDGQMDNMGFEFSITLCNLHLREETDGRYAPKQVCFSHVPDDVREIERLLGCSVRTHTPWNGWTMSRETWELPFRRRDPILQELLNHQAKEMLSRFPSNGSFVSEVQRILVPRVAGGNTDIREVARTLSISVRSLQRQLSAESASYRSVLESTRKEAAERYLSETSMPIGEVAYLLGYSESAAFHRAFQRWRHQTPYEFRQSSRSRS